MSKQPIDELAILARTSNPFLGPPHCQSPSWVRDRSFEHLLVFLSYVAVPQNPKLPPAKRAFLLMSIAKPPNRIGRIIYIRPFPDISYDLSAPWPREEELGPFTAAQGSLLARACVKCQASVPCLHVAARRGRRKGRCDG